MKRVYQQPIISYIKYEVDGPVALKISDEATDEQLVNQRKRGYDDDQTSADKAVEWGNLW